MQGTSVHPPVPLRPPYAPGTLRLQVSVPSRPAYFFGTLSSCTRSPSASSPMATDTPPAPKSLHFLIMCATSSRRNSLWILRSVGALPFCTSAPQTSMDVCGMCLGRTGRTADAVTTGTAAQQNDDISRIGGQSLHRTSRSRTHHCTDLHTLRHIIRMIYLFYITGCQTDLVTVRTVTVCRLAHQLLLRQLARGSCLSQIPSDLPHRSHALPDRHRYVRKAGHGSHRPGRLQHHRTAQSLSDGYVSHS